MTTAATQQRTYLINEPPTQFPSTLAAMTSVNAAIVIQKIHNWLWFNSQDHKEATHFFDGRWWCYNTYSEWQKKNFPYWSERTIKRIFAGLRQRGLIECRESSKENLDGNWVTINYDALDKLMGVLSSPPCQDVTGSSLTPGQVVIPPMPKPDDSTEIIPEINSESTLADDPVSEPTAARPMTREDRQKQMRGNHSSPLKGKDEPAVPDNTIRIDHPLVKLFMDETGVQFLTPEMSKKLTDTITVIGEESKATYPSLIRMWDERDGFSTFVTQRIAENKAAQDLMTPVNLLKHLRNFKKDTGMIGWLSWKLKHPELCTRVAAEPEAVVTIGDMIPE